MAKMKCKKCGREHLQSDSNCCWISCGCGESICGVCGSSSLVHDDSTNPEDENGDDQYWCCQMCSDCGLVGCGMCV